MRIWQCTRLDVDGVGGVETHIAQVSAGLRRLGHEVHVGPVAPEGWLGGAEPIVLHTHGDQWPNLTLLRERGRGNVIWIHVCHGTSVGRVIACREFLSLSGWRGSVTDFFPAHLANAVVAVGPQALHEARVYFRMKLPARVIANGADPEVFAPLLQIALEPRLIYVGRSGDRVKNVPRLLEACSSLAETVPGLALWCAPGIDYDYTVHPFVRNLGPLRGPELAATLAKSRALVLISLYEGDPIVLHEAQSMGLPVVASDIPQIRASLGGYTNSIFVNPRNIESITFGLRSATTGAPPIPAPRSRDWKQVATEFEAFYRELSAAKK